MNLSRKLSISAIAFICLSLFSGCVEIQQTIHLQHDGSGHITEQIKILPRTLRLMKGRQARTGSSEPEFQFLSEEALQQRLSSFGAVALKDQKRSTLPDGSLQIDATYTFSDINKVNLWMAPLFKGNNATREGKMAFKYERIISKHGTPPRYFNADQFSVRLKNSDGFRAQYSAPSTLMNFNRIAPMFQDMIKGLKLSIDLVAPFEEFDDNSMVQGLRFDKNRVTLLYIDGRNVGSSKEMIKQFISGEVDGIGKYSRGGPWHSMERSVPNTITPFTSRAGAHVNFLKLTEAAPPPGTPKPKKKEPKKKEAKKKKPRKKRAPKKKTPKKKEPKKKAPKEEVKAP